MNTVNWLGIAINLVFFLAGIGVGGIIEQARVRRIGKRILRDAERNTVETAKELSVEEKASRIAYLLAQYMLGKITMEENEELDEWVGSSDKRMRIFEILTDEKNVGAAMDYLNNLQNKSDNEQT